MKKKMEKGQQKMINILALALCVLLVAISFIYLYKYTDVFVKEKEALNVETNNTSTEIDLNVEIEEGNISLDEKTEEEIAENNEIIEENIVKSESEIKEEVSQQNELEKIKAEEQRVEKIEIKLKEIISDLVLSDVIVGDLCDEGPKPLDTGKIVYPIEEKYNHLNYLGQIFTATKCGEDRLSDFWGVSETNYTMGSKIELNNVANKDLLDTLLLLKYSCDEGDIISDCLKWSLEGDIPTKSLLLLEPFADMIKTDDCINCR